MWVSQRQASVAQSAVGCQLRCGVLREDLCRAGGGGVRRPRPARDGVRRNDFGCIYRAGLVFIGGRCAPEEARLDYWQPAYVLCSDRMDGNRYFPV